MSTIFDKILSGEIPAKRIYEDEFVLAFADIQPQAPTHVLVIPKAKVRCFAELSTQSPATVGQLFIGAAKVAKQLRLDESGYRIVINNGRDAQQTVDYLHLHILGGRALSWPPG